MDTWDDMAFFILKSDIGDACKGNCSCALSLKCVWMYIYIFFFSCLYFVYFRFLFLFLLFFFSQCVLAFFVIVSYWRGQHCLWQNVQKHIHIDTHQENRIYKYIQFGQKPKVDKQEKPFIWLFSIYTLSIIAIIII